MNKRIPPSLVFTLALAWAVTYTGLVLLHASGWLAALASVAVGTAIGRNWPHPGTHRASRRRPPNTGSTP